MIQPGSLKRPASSHDEQQQPEQPQPLPPGAGAAPTQQLLLAPRRAPDVRGDLEEDGREKSAKSLRITTSKILGTAQPRKPRIGPQFQADIPPAPADGSGAAAASAPEAQPPGRPLPLHRQLQLAREAGLRAQQQAVEAAQQQAQQQQ